GSINTQLEKFMESVKRKEKDETENNERPSGENPFIEGLSILESGNDQIKTSVDKPTIINEELKDMVYQMRERCFEVDGKDRIENMRLRKFLDDNTIKRKALELIQNEGTFCKFVADILISNSQILKFYFPSQYTRKNKDQLFGQDIVKAFMITAKYLGAAIISEFKHYLSHGIHLVNTRTGDKVKRKANVTFFELSHKPTFFSEEEIVSQENDVQE
uniref:RGS domain-containing protein n=1 Tax=Strongyloides papillosus TaxID=174720 RepID=A0A0N5B1Q8_STREA